MKSSTVLTVTCGAGCLQDQKLSSGRNPAIPFLQNCFESQHKTVMLLRESLTHAAPSLSSLPRVACKTVPVLVSTSGGPAVHTSFPSCKGEPLAAVFLLSELASSDQ